MTNVKLSDKTERTAASITNEALTSFVGLDTSGTPELFRMATPQLRSLLNIPGGGAEYVSAEIEVSSYATAGSGTALSPWTGWETAIVWSAFTRYRFRSGHYAYATSPNFLQYGIELIGEPGTYITHTGTGNAFVMDAGSTPGSLWMQNVRVENLIILGSPRLLTGTLSVSINTTAVTGTGTAFLSEVSVDDAITFSYGTSQAKSYIVSAVNSDSSLTINRNATFTQTNSQAKCTKTQNGIYLRGVRNGVFERMSVKDVAKAGLWTEACVTNSLRMFRCTFHEPDQSAEFECRPQYGIVTSGRGADWSTTWHIEEPVIEGMQIYGVWFKSDSYGHSVINGTSEANPGTGMQIDGIYNVIIGIDLEANSGEDLVVNGSHNNFVNVMSFGATRLTAGGSRNTFAGGVYNSLTIDATAFLNNITAVRQITSLVDNGNDTLYLYKIPGSNHRSFVGIPMSKVTSITAGGSMATNSALANLFTVNMSVDCTINAPTNALNSAEITYRFDNNSGAPRSITWNSVFQSVGLNIMPTSVPNGESRYVTFCYSSFWSKWQCTRAS